ncbi:MAG: M50 family metallopeptidase [Kofleriaceae bacterium]|nr:M50 family metallopeptidase [Kofleriaceae bacterium]
MAKPHPPSPFLIALLLSLLVCNLPFGGLALYPMKLLATWFHELSHGIAMLLCGAGFDRMLIYQDTSGLSYGSAPAGAIGAPIIAAAGYMGTPLMGAALLWATPTEHQARGSLAVLAAVVLISTWLTVANQFGLVAMTLIGAAIAACGLVLPARWRLLALHIFAAQACVNALLDIRVLYRPAMMINGQMAGGSDASTMAQLTFDTQATWAQWFWATAWLVWSLLVLFIALRRAHVALTQDPPTT